MLPRLLLASCCGLLLSSAAGSQPKNELNGVVSLLQHRVSMQRKEPGNDFEPESAVSALREQLQHATSFVKETTRAGEKTAASFSEMGNSIAELFVLEKLAGDAQAVSSASKVESLLQAVDAATTDIHARVGTTIKNMKERNAAAARAGEAVAAAKNVYKQLALERQAHVEHISKQSDADIATASPAKSASDRLTAKLMVGNVSLAELSKSISDVLAGRE